MDYIEKHYVNFWSPGTLVPEVSQKEIPSWDVELAMDMAHGITERHNATPWGFCFITRSRGPDDLDSKETARSKTYHLGGRVETLEEINARNDPKEEILRWNMEHQKIKAVVINDNSWRSTQPLKEGEVVLDFVPRKKRQSA